MNICIYKFRNLFISLFVCFSVGIYYLSCHQRLLYWVGETSPRNTSKRHLSKMSANGRNDTFVSAIFIRKLMCCSVSKHIDAIYHCIPAVDVLLSLTRRRLCDRSGRYVCISYTTTGNVSWFHWNLVLWCDLQMGRTDWLTFVGPPVPDTDSGSFFLFSRYCRILRDLFLTPTFTTSHGHTTSMKWLTPTRYKWIHNILEAIR